MGQSDSRPRLGVSLWSALATHPRRRPSRRPRSGLLGPDAGLSCVRRPSTPVERRRLALRRRTCCLQPRERPRPPRPSPYRGSLPAPHTTPVYASDPASPRRPQDSVPACLLRRWPGGTSTRRSSSVLPSALPPRVEIGQTLFRCILEGFSTRRAVHRRALASTATEGAQVPRTSGDR
jgi:hypothetical protein